MRTAKPSHGVWHLSHAFRLTVLLSLSCAILSQWTVAQTAKQIPATGKRYPRLVIRNAMIVDGNGTPASGPKDVVIEGNMISEVVPLDPVALKAGRARRPAGDVEIDATGRYVLPGLINAHAHVQDERGGVPQPVDYELKMWLACGITTVRDVGSDTKKTLVLRERSRNGEVAAPRVFVYPMFTSLGPVRNAEQARARVREFKQMGADGIKLLGTDRDIMAAMQDEAHKLGLRTAHHTGVEETNAWDDIKFGTTSIEHWYGIPDAAIEDGRQNFPSTYNYNNEVDRFRYAGRLWREADPERLMKVLDGLIEARVAWVPTMDIYEASRDLQRAQTQPWFADYLHPTLEEYFKPNPANHGSYFIGWSSTDETFWKENYRIWMSALKEFERRGGLIGAGDDAGFIYQMYGFGLIRELELHQEAGFHPIKVIQHATGNNAKILGEEERLGRVRAGFLADLIVVNGNPLENLKVLYPTGVDEVRDGKTVHTGGVEWTIKDGYAYHGPTLMKEIKEMVAKARSERASKAAQQ
ncbi:MAG TPA: amidohydrolase family protein [Blastocatellia bacterium]|nr:amidohydrolase family protein [Blastocatellia bacterium]